jgi:hypothetical protein
MSTDTLQDEIIMTVYSSQGKNQNRIRIKKGLLWGDAKKIVRTNGYNIDSMKAIEGTRKGVLEHPKALLPDHDFSLHLYPVKSKGGSKKDKVVTRPRKELVEAIKKHIAGHGEKAKNFFSGDKSYTNTSTEELDVLLTKWEKKHGEAPDVEVPVSKKKSKSVKAVSEEKSEAISGVVDSLAQQSEARTPAMIIRTSIRLLRDITGHENQTDIEQAITYLDKALITKPTPTEQELLAREHAELAEGLEGIIR